MSALNCKKTSADECGSLFALIDERISQRCEAALKERGFEVIKLPPSELLPTPVASHTDMLIFRHNNKLILSRAYAESHPELICRLRESLTWVDINFSSESFGEKYPADAIFNCLTLGNRLFGKTDSMSRAVAEYAIKSGMEIISVNQGYPACTTLALPRGFAITSDGGMERALLHSGIEVMRISESDKIKLPPYKFGFIGGSAGVFGNTVYFLGNLSAHPDCGKITQALGERGYCCVSLDPDADSLSDLGGILFIGRDENKTALIGSSISPAIPKTE